jgi:hypothetical protein
MLRCNANKLLIISPTADAQVSGGGLSSLFLIQ